MAGQSTQLTEAGNSRPGPKPGQSKRKLAETWPQQ